MGEPDFLPSAYTSAVVARLVTADDRVLRVMRHVYFAESATDAAVAIPRVPVLDEAGTNGGVSRLALGRARITIALPRGELILRWQAVERTSDRTDLPGGNDDALVFHLSDVLRRRLCSFAVLREAG
jgi:hypothetical protein